MLTGESPMAEKSAAKAIFINYRRDDAGGEAGRLFDDLTREFGADKVFMDVAGIQPGADFRKAIDSNVAGCGVLLAVIGPQWSAIANHAGQRRLDDPNDFVRLELAAALMRNIPVIPVLVHGAGMPTAEMLPDALKELVYRNGVELSLVRWRSDLALLLPELKKYVRPRGWGQYLPAKIGVATLLVAAGVYLAARPKPGTSVPPAAKVAVPGTLTQPQPAVSPPVRPLEEAKKLVPHVSPVLPAGEQPQSGKAHIAKQPELAAKAVPAPNMSAVTPAVSLRAAYQSVLPYNLNGIYADGMRFSKKASVDGVGDAYHPFTKPDDSSGMLTVRGITFRLGAVNQLNALHGSHSRAVSIELPGKAYKTLAMLGMAVHQSQAGQSLGVEYGDPTPSTQTVTQGFSDWSASDQLRFPGEEVAVLNTYRNTSDGIAQPGTFALYLYRVPLDPTKPVVGLTLPKNEAVVILAVTLLP